MPKDENRPSLVLGLINQLREVRFGVNQRRTTHVVHYGPHWPLALARKPSLRRPPEVARPPPDVAHGSTRST